MTEQELRDRLNSLTEAIPDETHRSFLMVASPGKDETVMKRKDFCRADHCHTGFPGCHCLCCNRICAKIHLSKLAGRNC